MLCPRGRLWHPLSHISDFLLSYTMCIHAGWHQSNNRAQNVCSCLLTFLKRCCVLLSMKRLQCRWAKNKDHIFSLFFLYLLTKKYSLRNSSVILISKQIYDRKMLEKTFKDMIKMLPHERMFFFMPILTTKHQKKTSIHAGWHQSNNRAQNVCSCLLAEKQKVFPARKLRC